jgi:hypothetical protein
VVPPELAFPVVLAPPPDVPPLAFPPLALLEDDAPCVPPLEGPAAPVVPPLPLPLQAVHETTAKTAKTRLNMGPSGREPPLEHKFDIPRQSPVDSRA